MGKRVSEVLETIKIFLEHSIHLKDYIRPFDVWEIMIEKKFHKKEFLSDDDLFVLYREIWFKISPFNKPTLEQYLRDELNKLFRILLK